MLGLRLETMGDCLDEGAIIMAKGALSVAKQVAVGHASSCTGRCSAVTRPFCDFSRFSDSVLFSSLGASDFATAVRGAVPPPTC